MADPVTLADIAALTSGHSDIRREAAEHTNEIVREGIRSEASVRLEGAQHTNEVIKEGLKGDFNTVGAIKDARFELASRVENSADRIERGVVSHNSSVMDRFFDIGRDSADLRAQVTQSIAETRGAADRNARDIEIAVLKSTIEGQKNTQYLADRISNDGEKTRALMSELKNAELNRMLIERNTDLHDERHHARHWRGQAEQSQFASLASQMQAFQSQLQETRQGINNFGTMAGVGMSSTSNNVR